METSLSRINIPTVDSTNTFVREMLAEESSGNVVSASSLPGFTLVVADDQTAGRGQKGNTWETEKGKNLIFSLLCHPDMVKASEQFVLLQCMAIAVRDALAKVADGVTVKWPNDIYVGEKKISGTLIECDLKGKSIVNCILGVGININQTIFSSNVPNPTSLRLLTGRDTDRETVLADIMERFQLYYGWVSQGLSEDVRKLYMQYLYRREGMHPYSDVRGDFMAEIADVEPTGHLLLRFETGQVVRYEFKDVRFLPEKEAEPSSL